MLANGKDVLQAALEWRYAVGAFNANGMEFVQAIAWAARDLKAPVVIQISPGATKYCGLDMAVAMTRVVAEEVPVPVVLHLDHGTTYEQNIACLEAGFTSLMFDGSELTFEENIAITAPIVKEAHAHGVPVEAELGHIPATEDYEHLLPTDYDWSYPLPREIQEDVVRQMARPDQVEEFVERTGCDSLAAALGSVHRMKGDVQPLYLERLREIRARTPIPIVCHGSSGVIRTQAQLQEGIENRGWQIPEGWGSMEEAIAEGLVKINVATAISMAYLRRIDEVRAADPREKDSRKVLGPGREAMQKAVGGYIRLFGSVDKAA
jgi:fructose-bisphosphate aldolase class II